MYALLRDTAPVRLGAEEAARHIDQAAELLRPAGHSRYLLIAEHAGNLVPEPWSDLGLPADLLSTHYGLDIGVDALTRNLSERMNAPAVLARYSRLFLDYNRRAEDWDALRPDLGGIPVPANLVADAEERALREAIARSPVDRMIESVSPRCQALVSVHSFSPLMHGTHRDVDIGILWCERTAFTEALFDRIHPAAAHLGLRIGDNEPYGWRREHG